MNKQEIEIAKLFEGGILSSSQISKLVRWLQMTPKTTTVRVNLLRVTTDEVIANILKTLRHYDYLPCIPLIERFEPLPEIIIIQSIDENVINKNPHISYKEVVVDYSCAAAVLRGAHIYCPGVLAMQSNTKLNEMVNIFADIEGIGEVKMQRFQLFGPDNPSKGIAIQVYQTISCVPSIGSDYLPYEHSLLQNFPSIVCSRVLDPKPDEIVLDMCASPGNKTTHLAQLMEDTGVLIALDKSEKRSSLLKENIKRFNLKSVQCYRFDATKALSTSCKIDWKPPYTEESFDKILLDAPCSGLGNRPLLRTKMNQRVLASFPKLQRKLLDVALQLLKIGGVLVYSTCSVFESENELNIVYLLAKYGDQIKLETAVPLYGMPGLSNVGLTDAQRNMMQRFGPNFEEIEDQKSIVESTGFFICKIRKISKLC